MHPDTPHHCGPGRQQKVGVSAAYSGLDHLGVSLPNVRIGSVGSRDRRALLMTARRQLQSTMCYMQPQ